MGIAFSVNRPRSTTLRALNYSPAAEAFQRRAKTGRCHRIHELAPTIGPSYGTVFTRLDCERSYGVELLSQSDMFATEPEGRIIRVESMPVPGDHLIRRWQILVAGAGTLGETELYGRSTLADARLENKYVGPDAVGLNFAEPGSDLNLYTYAFLNTKAGNTCVRSTSYGTKILRFRNDLFRNLPVPLKDDGTTALVASLMRESVKQRELSASHICSARKPIDDLPEVIAANNMCSRREKRSLSWDGELTSLCAWNYASTGGAFQHLSKCWSGRLLDVLDSDGFFYGPRFARIGCRAPYGIKFLSQRDVFLVRSLPRRIVHPGCEDRLLFVPERGLLVAAQGQLQEGNLFGRVEIGATVAEGCAVSEAVFRIVPQEEHYEVLYAFLSTKLGGALIRSAAVGTSVPKISPDILLKLPVPELSAPIRSAVQQSVRDALQSRRLANEAESRAIQIIEEEVLPEWLS